ncbi:hypothetical protein HaLaN_03297 [Haematococcus lacustris]|uniref:Uncharacterized protein n=1 Tax=Haematococcus lacustris TaxID=44745 RepID=A0A699YFX0_HAELA|nr:hypothetical protein HaLaN_03297 [Haematococcus lacustris]
MCPRTDYSSETGPPRDSKPGLYKHVQRTHGHAVTDLTCGEDVGEDELDDESRQQVAEQRRGRNEIWADLVKRGVSNQELGLCNNCGVMHLLGMYGWGTSKHGINLVSNVV